MAFQAAITLSVVAFMLVLAGVIFGFIAGVLHAYRDTPDHGHRVAGLFAGGLGLWMLLLTVLITTGSMEKLPYHGLPLFFGPIVLIALGVGLSPLGGRIAANVPVRFLVLFQAFRLSLELVLHGWALQGTIPETMTWNGQNWDIVSGTVALLCFPWADRHRAVAWFANLVGFALLINVMRVAIMSSPLPFAWDVHPPLVLALHLPYTFIGPVCVGGALAGHIVLTRALLKPKGNH